MKNSYLTFLKSYFFIVLYYQIKKLLTMNKKILCFLLLCVYVAKNYSQQVWRNDLKINYSQKISDAPSNYHQLKLNQNQLATILRKSANRFSKHHAKTILTLPIAGKKFEDFEILKASNFSKKLHQKFPSINSYVAKSLTTNKTARISYSKHTGLYAYIQTSEGTRIVKPLDHKTNSYVHFKRSDTKSFNDFECTTIETTKRNFFKLNNKISANDGYLRKYRLALATTGEFSNFFLTGSETTDEEKKAVVLSAINNSLTRINSIFERDFGVTMELIDNNDQLIFLDGNNDPFSTGGFNNQIQNTLDTTIGTGNYDVGHVFVLSNRKYGSAGCIACVCTEGSKGSAFSAHHSPDTDDFNMLAAHEFGHQYGGLHVQSSANCRSAFGLQEVEPGSGSTIMSYAGICAPNVQFHSDDYFNYVDIRDVIEWTRNNSSCAELIATGNNDPTANAGNDYTIPISTPFILEGSGSDNDANSSLTYCWEQNNPEDPLSTSTPQPTWSQGPLFRSKLPTESPIRYIPQLEDVVQGNLTPTWEVVPSVSRAINFVLTVRDNASSGAKTASDEMIINTTDTAGPFVVTSQNSAENWNVGDTKKITWDVANTDVAPINASHVEILLSTDGGFTYPHTIISNTPNDGSQEIIIPEIPESTTQGRIMIKPVDNIFYAINSNNINIQVSEFIMSFNQSSQEVCKPDVIEYDFTYKTYLSFRETTTFTVENLPNNLTASFSPNTAIDNNTPIKLTITGTNNLAIDNYTFNVVGTTNTTVKKASLEFNIFESTILAPTLTSPVNNSTGINISPLLSWESDDNSATYLLEIATDNNFNTIIESSSLSENSYNTKQVTNFNTTYFWRVKSTNTCGDSDYSETFSFTTKCSTPSSINTTADKDNIQISWSDSNDSNNWEIEVVLNNTLPTGIGTITNTNPYTASNLQSGTTYDIYVKSLCSDTNSSDWAGPYSVTTLADFCNGDKFYDPGIEGNYPKNQNVKTIILPENANVVEVNFSYFQIESGYDYLYVYDGNDTDAPLIGRYTGMNSPGLLRSKINQGLTFVFTSDHVVTDIGWEATVNCITITCPEPSDFNYTNISGNSIDLEWTVNGSENKWLIEHGSKGFTPGNGIKTQVSSNPITIEGLTPETEYDFYVKAICGETPSEDDSFNVGPISVKTPCGTFDTPFNNGAENQNTGSSIENCMSATPDIYQANFFWETYSSTNSSTISTGPHKAYEGNKYYRTSPSSYSNSGDQAFLQTPFINIDNLTVPTLNFFSYMHGKNIGSLHVDVWSNNNWTTDVLVINGEQQSSATELWSEHLIDLSDYSGDILIRFKAISGGTNTNEIDIDAISVIEKPSCPNPSKITYEKINGNTVNFSWDANGGESKWVLEYGHKGYTKGNGVKIMTTTNPTSINTLLPETEYDFYLTAICGENPNEDDSNAIGPIGLKTLCSTFSIPFNNGAENQYTSNTIQNCMSATPDVYQNAYYWVAKYSNYSNSITTGPYKANEGNKYYSTNNPYQNSKQGDEASLFTPVVNIDSANNPTLNFNTFMFGENVGSLHIDIRNNGNWNNDIYVINGQQQTSPNDLWQEHLVDLSNFSGEITVRFRAISGGETNNEIDIDSINIIEKPSCPNPTNFNYDNITATTVDLTWTSNGEENNWEVEYGLKGFTIGYGTTVQTDTNNFTLENLPSNTELDIYLRAVCGNASNEDNSEFIGPIQIKTLCGIYSTPYTNGAENQNTNSILQNCIVGLPEIYQGNYFWEAQYSPQNSSNVYGPYKAQSGNKYYRARAYNSTSGDEANLLTPNIDISTVTTPTLHFYTFMHGENIGSLHVDILNNGTWTNDIFSITGSQQTSVHDLWDEHFIDLSQFTDIIKVRFRAVTAEGYGLKEIDIDDISIIEKPSCIKPTNIKVSNETINSVDLSWITNNNENNWTLEYGIENFSIGSGTQVNVSNNPYTLENLNSNTTYDVYIKSNCNTNNSSEWNGPFKFKTKADFCNGDHFYDTGGASGNYSNNENYTTTIYPKTGTDIVTVFFNYFEIENCCDYLYIYDGPDTNANLIGQYNGTNSPGNIASTHSSGALTFKFTSSNYTNYGGWDATVLCESDTCLTPINTLATNISYNSAQIQWEARGNETSWFIEYGEKGFTPGTGNNIQILTNPITLNNLTSDTEYDIYVTANCEGTPSTILNPYSFKTTPNYCNGDRFYDSGGIDGNYKNNENYITTIYPQDNADFVSVTFNSFSTEGCCDRLYIYDGDNTNAILIGSYAGNNSPGTIISTHETGALTFSFTSDSSITSSGWDATVECGTLSCPKPTNIQIENITQNSVDINWIAGSNEQSWEIEYGQTGFTQGNGTLIQVDNNNYTINDLGQLQSYDVYVRANCGSTDNSLWAGPFSFATNCNLTAPFYENFSSNSVPNCWTQYGSENWNFSTGADYDAQNAGDFTSGGNTNYAWIDGSSPNGPNQTSNLFTEIIDISNLSEPALQFSVFSKNTISNSFNSLLVKVHNTASTAHTLLQLQGATENGGWQTFTYDLSDYIESNLIHIEFIITENSPESPYHNDILIDDVRIDNLTTLGTKEVNILDNVSYYPNPVKDNLKINSPELITKVEVYSILGRKLLDKPIKEFNNVLDIDFSNYASGTYLVKVFAQNRLKSFRILKE
ncbi:T9SS type A sorting domain-containing protein [Tenacibaculum sp. 190524A02b]